MCHNMVSAWLCAAGAGADLRLGRVIGKEWQDHQGINYNDLNVWKSQITSGQELYFSRRWTLRDWSVREMAEPCFGLSAQAVTQKSRVQEQQKGPHDWGTATVQHFLLWNKTQQDKHAITVTRYLHYEDLKEQIMYFVRRIHIFFQRQNR